MKTQKIQIKIKISKEIVEILEVYAKECGMDLKECIVFILEEFYASKNQSLSSQE
ncbi:MAG: hypothetical protein J6R08_08165 [Opitutales bacterium]|nr:hypothetical protein [Opitutales bacterium]